MSVKCQQFAFFLNKKAGYTPYTSHLQYVVEWGFHETKPFHIVSYVRLPSKILVNYVYLRNGALHSSAHKSFLVYDLSEMCSHRVVSI